MTASAAKQTLSPSASIQTAIDLFLGPAVIALALLFSAFLPSPAWAQTSSAVDYQFQRALSKIVAGSASGLVVKQPGTMNIVNAGKVVGSFALNEKRLIDLATLAKYARASTVPAVLALGATELIKYGLEKCADGTWCKRQDAQQTPTEGYNWHAPAYNISANSFEDGCVKVKPLFSGDHCGVNSSNTETRMAMDVFTANNQRIVTVYWDKQLGCASGYALQPDGTCKKAAEVVPATGADVETAWKSAFETNPFIQEQYWGFEDQTKNLAAWEAALAQTAEVINGTATEVRPAESITKPKADGGTETTTKQTTCTYTATANTDTGTVKENPVKVTERCTTTTTAPDGTQTQEVTEKAATPQGQAKVPEKVDIETCGLPGKPACKIDETGTQTEQKAETVTATTSAMDSAMTQQKTALDNVLNGEKPETNWASWLPQIPRSQCQPMGIDVLAVTVSVDWCPAVPYLQTLSTLIWVFVVMGGCIAEVKDALNGA